MALIRLKTNQLDNTLTEVEGVVLTRRHPAEGEATIVMILRQHLLQEEAEEEEITTGTSLIFSREVSYQSSKGSEWSTPDSKR